MQTQIKKSIFPLNKCLFSTYICALILNPINNLKLKTMTKETSIKLFQDKKVRSVWDDENEKWYFSVVDVIAVLTESENPQVYWRVLKKRLSEEGNALFGISEQPNQTVTNCNGLKNETVASCHSLKLLAPDGKMRLTDVADAKQILRLIQSIPSPKAEPFKLWLAQVGYERLQEIENPELGRTIISEDNFLPENKKLSTALEIN